MHCTSQRWIHLVMILRGKTAARLFGASVAVSERFNVTMSDLSHQVYDSLVAAALELTAASLKNPIGAPDMSVPCRREDPPGTAHINWPNPSVDRVSLQ